jgi:hypothetical protein
MAQPSPRKARIHRRHSSRRGEAMFDQGADPFQGGAEAAAESVKGQSQGGSRAGPVWPVQKKSATTSRTEA